MSHVACCMSYVDCCTALHVVCSLLYFVQRVACRRTSTIRMGSLRFSGALGAMTNDTSTHLRLLRLRLMSRLRLRVRCCDCERLFGTFEGSPLQPWVPMRAIAHCCVPMCAVARRCVLLRAYCCIPLQSRCVRLHAA